MATICWCFEISYKFNNFRELKIVIMNLNKFNLIMENLLNLINYIKNIILIENCSKFFHFYLFLLLLVDFCTFQCMHFYFQIQYLHIIYLRTNFIIDKIVNIIFKLKLNKNFINLKI